MKALITVILINVAIAGTILAKEDSNSESNSNTDSSTSSGSSGQTEMGDNFPKSAFGSGSKWAVGSNLQSQLDGNQIDTMNSPSLQDLEKWAQSHNFNLTAGALSDLESWIQNHHSESSGNALADLENMLQSEGQMNQSGNDDLGMETNNQSETEQEFDDEQTIQAVPEPGSTMLLVSGALLIGSSLLRRRK
jgi:hypothetical protein